jgi:hypothetical protein
MVLCQYRRIKEISPTRYRLDQGVIAVAELSAQLSNSLFNGIVTHDHVWPYSIEKLSLGHQSSSVVREIAKHLKRLWPQLDILLARAQTSTREIERKPVEV